MAMRWRLHLFACVATLTAAVGAVPSEAIVRRHDRPDRDYQIPATEAPAFVDVMGQVGGTLIAPQWVLTAAHSVEGVDPFSDWRVYIGGRRYDVEKIIITPGRVEGAVDPDFDIALLKLAAPVVGISPVPLYRWGNEMGMRAMIVGRGDHGAARYDNRPFRRDANLRRAYNRIEGVFEHSLAFVFDAPPRGDPLEGLGAAGDSGGPAFIEHDGVLFLAGVDSTNSADGIETARYGTLGAYTRVSAHRVWIETTIAADPPSSLVDWPPLTRITQTSEFPITAGGRLASSFWDALSSGQSDAVVNFFERHGASNAGAPETQARYWLELWREFGAQTLWGFSALNENDLVFVSRRSEIWRGYLLSADASDTSRINTLFSGALAGPPHSPDE
jgi:hypothetical protein